MLLGNGSTGQATGMRRTGGAGVAAEWGTAAILLAWAVGGVFVAQSRAASGAATSGGAAAAAVAGWEESAGLRCVVSDSMDPGARIFDSPDYQQSLVVPSAGDHAFLLALRSQTVRSMPKSSLQWDSAGRPAPNPADGEDAGGFLSQEGSMLFTAGDETYAIEPEPPLVGELTLEKLRAAKPDYVYAAERYTPDAKAIAALKGVTQDTQFVVFFGSWCSHCKHWMPGFLKTVEAAANPHVSVAIYGMNEDQTEPAAAMRKYGTSRTPTFIVLRAGKELGRIEEEPTGTVEGDLAQILGAK